MTNTTRPENVSRCDLVNFHIGKMISMSWMRRELLITVD